MSPSEFFFDHVTEEIRIQVEGMLALTERLCRQHLSADAVACVEGIDEAAHSVSRLLSTARDLKIAAAEQLALNPARHQLRDLMDEVQERWISRARESGVTLLVAYEGDPAAAALVDAHRLHQIFDGYIGQAISGVRHGAVEASLQVVSAQAGSLRLEGRVRGAGEVVDGSLSGSIEEIAARFGLETAMGAALGQRILQALDGLGQTERNAGGGETAVFTLLAPCAPEDAAEPAETASDRAAHVLIVDDNATNRMVAETLCEMFDCTAETAVDGVEAVELAKSGRFDLILMDIKMPRMDGVDATRAIRALQGPASQTPIIALTANADPEDAAGYIAAGMIGVVEKPMKPESLLRALQQALGQGDAKAA
ncbi:MAG: response regulator [Phenylobacterium sp.]|uniref:response regulator n=1 Tax=Phenylobacterium sp. TaxID=1871053 RepID=UPI002726D851|nr:response regulator [Phenylobacterium sp.]MDO8901274.1 response regulator [Phenylobacterium sp.]MDP2214971.1 response regulator [Phenylobacterium sp.]